jgi:DNA-binding XRE family transcriptional regulator
MTKKIKRSYKNQNQAEYDRDKELAELAEGEADQAEARRARDRSRRMRSVIAELKAERERQGLSLAAVADRIGLNRQNLHRLETNPNANPTLETIHRLAEALGKSVHLELRDLDEAA